MLASIFGVHSSVHLSRANKPAANATVFVTLRIHNIFYNPLTISLASRNIARCYTTLQFKHNLPYTYTTIVRLEQSFLRDSQSDLFFVDCSSASPCTDARFLTLRSAGAALPSDGDPVLANKLG